MTPKTAAAAGALLALAALAGCGTTGAALAPAAGAGPVVLDETADRTRVTVAAGSTVRTELHSTYWSPATSTDPALLAPAGPPSTAAGPSCQPGGGCGTVTTAFTARTPGTVRLTAHRSSCGEAKPCPPGEQDFTVEVEVTR
ncbi:hypothetical protein [Kitasatospora cheerisanensis]|uniref:Proteinase inhibitor I42 chagasin domain-containing protein n=1 Tax=Kitasatospora cheerisanensis KCTC 2395 TaxID=1348663 RepID=A0A066ZCW9_9ACTN|nr:hypothetical protein [Kitasatospora cheerisanensis]KDN88151.1 hypothetical protein KCH_00830 [Kitasatospora cheerisanensis KCTC 2395]